ncbi:MAG: hypothetical protein QOC92_1453 [Acidimicrobiaceae bacterium]|jgi:hypothetical protein
MRVSESDASTIRGDMEDDFHCFGVTLRHDGRRVIDVIGDGVRYPWTTCPSAVEPLRDLAGAPLSTRLSALGDHAPARQNCTHLFDLAGLAVAHAARGRGGTRTYDVAIPDRDGTRTQPELWRDGELLFRWSIAGRQIIGPPPFENIELRGGFIAWAEETLDADTAEAASVLRRACDISFGRSIDLDVFVTADMLGERVRGTCHSFQPGMIEQAERVKGQTRDFTSDPDALLQPR